MQIIMNDEFTWFYCADCGALFQGMNAHIESGVDVHWWLDDCPKEYWSYMYCPECRSDNIEVAPECDGCGEIFRPQDLVDGFCEKCRKEEWSNDC